MSAQDVKAPSLRICVREKCFMPERSAPYCSRCKEPELVEYVPLHRDPRPDAEREAARRVVDAWRANEGELQEALQALAAHQEGGTNG